MCSGEGGSRVQEMEFQEFRRRGFKSSGEGSSRVQEKGVQEFKEGG